MTLEDGINLYVQRKHAAGMSFQEGRKVYRSFLKMVGNMPLSQITIDHVSRFLNRPDTSAGAFRVKHSLLRRLFEFCSVHGAMERLTMPLNRPAQRSTFLPYIYTRDELRSMLRKAPTLKMANDTIDHRTLRAALVVLYATGATPSEVTKLVNGDVDLRIGYINFPGSRLKSERRIPIGRDLARVARIYL